MISISNAANMHNTVIQFGTTLRIIDIPTCATSILPLKHYNRNRERKDDMESVGTIFLTKLTCKDETPALHKFLIPVVLGTKGGHLYILDMYFPISGHHEYAKKSRRTQFTNFSDFNRQAFDMIHGGNVHPLIYMDFSYPFYLFVFMYSLTLHLS